MLLARPEGGSASKAAKDGKPGKKGRKKGTQGQQGLQFEMRKTATEAAGGTGGDGLSAPPIRLPKRSGLAPGQDQDPEQDPVEADAEDLDDEPAPEE